MRWVCQKAPAALATFQDYLSGQELAGRRQGWDGDQGEIGPGQDRAVAAVGEWERKAGSDYPPIAYFGRKQGDSQAKGALTVCPRPGRHEGRGLGGLEHRRSPQLAPAVTYPHARCRSVLHVLGSGRRVPVPGIHRERSRAGLNLCSVLPQGASAGPRASEES